MELRYNEEFSHAGGRLAVDVLRTEQGSSTPPAAVDLHACSSQWESRLMEMLIGAAPWASFAATGNDARVRARKGKSVVHASKLGKNGILPDMM